MGAKRTTATCFLELFMELKMEGEGQQFVSQAAMVTMVGAEVNIHAEEQVDAEDVGDQVAAEVAWKSSSAGPLRR